MSGRQFAAITASLLARKGEAMPSIVRATSKAPILWSSDPRMPATAPLPHLFAGEDDFAAERAILRNGHARDPVQEQEPEHDLRNGYAQDNLHEHDLRDDHAGVAQFSDYSQAERRTPAFDGIEKRHRISLALSQQEHEKLGIVAVKKGLTRHQLMRDALDHYFEKLASEYQSECACIALGGCRNGCVTE